LQAGRGTETLSTGEAGDGVLGKCSPPHAGRTVAANKVMANREERIFWIIRCLQREKGESNTAGMSRSKK